MSKRKSSRPARSRDEHPPAPTGRALAIPDRAGVGEPRLGRARLRGRGREPPLLAGEQPPPEPVAGVLRRRGERPCGGPVERVAGHPRLQVREPLGRAAAPRQGTPQGGPGGRHVRPGEGGLVVMRQVVVEPGGVVALASLLYGGNDYRGKTVGIILSGGNVDPEIYREALSRG